MTDESFCELYIAEIIPLSMDPVRRHGYMQYIGNGVYNLVIL